MKLAGLVILGVLLSLSGFFSPWFPHPSAGLALTGFEVGEWIKFVPEVRAGATHLRRTNFYWPPVVAAVACALLAVRQRAHGWQRWSLISLATLISLVPFPALEEISNLEGIRANLGRLLLVGLGLLATVLAAARRQLPARVWGMALALAGAAGVVLVSLAFSTAEPMVERLLNQLIDPTLAYHLTRGGMALLTIGGIARLFDR